MNATHRRDLERLDELLADEAAAALAAADATELDELLARHGAADRDQLVQAAALAQVAFLRQARRNSAIPGTTLERMPAGLRARLERQAGLPAARLRAVAPPATVAPRSTPAAPVRSSMPASAWLGWGLAAVLAGALVMPRTDQPAPPPDFAAERSALVAGAPDVVVLPWSPPASAGYEEVTGDVVWSESRQQGYLRLANMPVNDPARSQYQLWIVDPERDTRPVDGGVFDVTAAGEVIIPIQAKLPVRAPRAFAITAEQPGGVVVSAGPLLVVATT